MPDGVIQTLIGAAKGPKGPPRPLPCQEVLLAGKAKTFFYCLTLKKCRHALNHRKLCKISAVVALTFMHRRLADCIFQDKIKSHAEMIVVFGTSSTTFVFFSLADEAQLQWPTKLALNPLDSTLHIVDDTIVLKLMPDMRLVVIAGMSPVCTANAARYNNQTKAAAKPLGPLMALDFNHDGMMYLVEKKSKTSLLHEMNRFGSTKVIGETNGSYAGITVSPSGDIYTANNEDLTTEVLRHELPEKDDESGEVQVPDSLAGEVYTFNRFSQHVATHSMDTGAKLYTFVYTKNTALGKLSDIIDGVGNTVSMKRNYAGQVQSIDNSLGLKHPVALTPMGLLKTLSVFKGRFMRPLEIVHQIHFD